MSTQPEALRLVNNRQNAHMLTWQANACAELRRLHEVELERDRLRESAKSADFWARAAAKESQKSKELLGALQAALEALRGSAGPDEISNVKKQGKAAIAKATGSAA